MKKILFALLLFVAKPFYGQYGCYTPSLGVYDNVSDALIPAVISCSYTNWIYVNPVQVFNGNNTQAVLPCLAITLATTNVSSPTNNSLTIYEGTVSAISLCSSSPCFTYIPGSATYSFALTGLNPASSHSYSLCNVFPDANFNYTVRSCYSNSVITSGVWNNSGSNSCQGVYIPPNTPIGTTSYTISPGIPSTGSVSTSSGYLFLDTYQMTPGTYTITMFFDSQAGCTSTATRTIQILPSYNASWTTLPNQCANGACVSLTTQVTGNTGGSFSGTGVSGNSFCPSTAGAGTFPVTYTVGVTPQCMATQSNNIVVNPLPLASAGPTKSITCTIFTPTLNASGGGTYNWTAGSGGSIISGGSSSNPVVSGAANYSVIVTSAAGCTAQAVTNVVTNNTPPAVSFTNSSGIVTCINNSTLTIGTSPSSGINYSWSGTGIVGATTNSAIAVNQGGNFTASFTNTANGCTGSSVLNVAANTTITNTPSTTGSVTCSMPSSISFSTSANGGPYSYTWTAPSSGTITSGQNSGVSNVNASASGNYTISVTNLINGCTSTSVIAANINTTAPTATAATSGTVTCISNAVNLTAQSGFNYSWSATGAATITGANNTQNTTGAGAGNYIVVITNPSNNCSVTKTVSPATNTSVITPTPIPAAGTLNCNTTNVTLSGNPSAGVTYSWTGPSAFSSTSQNPSVSNPGTYTLVVTNASNGCQSASNAGTVNVTQTLTQPTITTSSALTPTLGCGSSSVITLSVTANPAGTTYTWTSSGGAFVGATNTSTANVTTATQYTVTAIHPTTGCKTTQVFTISPSSGASPVTMSSTSATITCATTTVNSIITTTGSVSTYSWSGPSIVGVSNTATVVAGGGGTYNYSILFSNGCTATGAFNVATNNAVINPNPVASNSVDCNNTSATISAAATPSTGTYSYTWSTGSTASSITVNPTSNTSYTVIAADPSNGCLGTAVITVTASTAAPSSFSTSTSSYTLSCSNPTTSITAGAVGAASYSWSAPTGTTGAAILSGSNSATAVLSGAGVFSVIAIGSNGCSTSVQTVTLVPNTNAPTYSLSNSNPSITCFSGAPSVSVTITSSVAITSYTWGPSSGISGSSSSSVVTFSAAGTYTGIITASNGCNSNVNITVSNNSVIPNFVAGTGTAQAISCTNSLVTIAPTFTPNSNLTYTWSGPGIVGSSNNSSVQVNLNGTYNLIVTNTLTGCSNASLSIPVVGSNIPPTLTVTSTSSIGIGCSPSISTVALSAGSSSSVNYLWSNGATTSVISTSTPGNYTVTVTNASSNCSSTQTISVANNSISPTLSITSNGNLPCGGGTTAVNATSSSTNTSTYNWAGVGVVSGNTSQTAIINTAGIYTVQVIDQITGCSATSTVSISSTSVNAFAVASPTQGVAPLQVTFTNQSTGATSYSWTLGNGNSTQQNPNVTYSNFGTYTVILLATNGSCSSTFTLEIIVNPSLGVIPQIFTPNGDGHNDTFYINGLSSYPNASLEVYNRWGNEVYKGAPYKNDWDGKANVTGALGSGKLPSGTYFYILDLKDGKSNPLKGFIELLY
ncbi:MAG: gliding motility-associated C-terminal domain-containing protein [Bacteroidetes bacterium]|nr:gliding motility-associated C-terminal domain-containing protein [Bacteroidota bacterium]